MELRELAGIAWRRRWIVLLVVAVTMTSAALFAMSLPEKYDSTSTIALTPDIQEGTGFIASDNLDALLGTYASTAESRVNLVRAERLRGRPLEATVEATTEVGTGILRLTATSEDPKEAAAVARFASRAFIDSLRTNPLLVAEVVDPAGAPDKPNQPRPPIILVVAGLLGLLLALMAAYGVDQFRRRIDTAADVTALTNVPVIGRLPRQRALARGDAQIVWGTQKLLGMQESLRALRTNIEFVAGDAIRVLQVTSPTVAQGKSTIVANLGIALGQVGIETVIVDGDLRRPRQHRIFGVDNSWGLSTLMVRRHDTAIDPLPTGYAGLSIIPSGPSPPDSTEMLHIAIEPVLHDIRELGTFVLVDSPPILPVSDARLIAPHADGVILVVAAGSQKPSALQSTLEKLDLAGANLLGIVLNQAGGEEDGAGHYYYEYMEGAPAQSERMTSAQ
jgi:capsular exopolysaccharide synthesis family protein